MTDAAAPASTPRQTAAEPIRRDGRNHGRQDRGEPYPDLRVVSLHDRLEKREIPGTSRVVGQGALDDVGEGALRSRDRRRLADVERSLTKRDEPEDERQAGAEQWQHAVEHGVCACFDGDRLARRGGGVGRSAHPDRG